MNALTSLPMELSTKTTPTAKLTNPAESATETTLAETFDESMASMVTPPAEFTIEERMEALVRVLRLFCEVVKAPAAEPPIETLAAAAAEAVVLSMMARSVAKTITAPEVVVT